MPAPAPEVRLLPDQPGVYRFRTGRDRVLYVGRAASLRRRVASYWGDLRDRGHLRRMVAQIERVEAVVCASAHEAAWLERNLLERELPRWNRTVGGAENPLWISLNTSAGRPGLRAVHLPAPGCARNFGPYLGGLKARRAVAALHRLLPIAYAGSRLTASQREMAALLKVDAADRDSMIGATAAILDRRPDAVLAARTVLEQRRERAAEKLAFELAGKIQHELAALDWVTSVQRVTRSDALEGEVCGWADGVLVRFGFTGGRLSSWTTERADRGPDGTPAEWHEFAAANAALAARLAVPRQRPGVAVSSRATTTSTATSS